MNYKPSDTMNLVHEVKKLGWHFTYSKENISINRHDVTLSLYREVDPEAWRDEYRKKQAAGVRFEKLWYDGFWRKGKCDFTGKKEDYREVPQESPKVKEIGVGIPEAARNILIAWQKSGLKFDFEGSAWDAEMFGSLGFFVTSGITIPEQPIPEGMSVEAVEAMWRQGLTLESYGFGWRQVSTGFNWNISCTGAELLKRLRIPAQPIPEKLLEVPQETSIADKLAFTENNVPQEPHAAERALWKAQREAGTNEVWQFNSCSERGWIDIPINEEPNWMPNSAYRVKPMKLTARICMVGKAYPMSYIGQDWEFTGTREEYRAECEKYGYVVISEITEVVEKPKTVTYYFALYKTPHGYITSISGHTKDWVNEWITDNGHTIIGDIEEREV